MSEEREDTPHPSGDEVGMVHVPREHNQNLQVIFLASYRSCITHYRDQRSWACPDPLGQCEPKIHRLGDTWKAYAPVEWLSDQNEPRWYPGVLEITLRLALVLGDGNLRGQVWKMWRRPYKGKSVEVTGHQIAQVERESLRTDVRVEPVVRRVLHSPVIAWDKPMPYEPPQKLESRPADVRQRQKPESEEKPLPINRITGLPWRVGDLMQLSPEERDRILANGNGRH